jgi:hypothetical protein
MTLQRARDIIAEHLRMQVLLGGASANRPGLRHHVPAYEHAANLLRAILKEIDRSADEQTDFQVLRGMLDKAGVAYWIAGREDENAIVIKDLRSKWHKEQAKFYFKAGVIERVEVEQ